MYYLFYHAVESTIFKEDKDGVQRLLEQATVNNERNQISGLLLFVEGTFIQYIEGEKEQILELYEKIKNDERIIAIKKIDEGESEKRYFEGWHMAFKEYDINILNKLQNINFPNIQAYLNSSTPLKLIKLLIKRKELFPAAGLL